MATAQDYVNDFRAMRKNVSESRALLWLNETDLLVQRILRTRKTTAIIALVAGQQDYDLDESYVCSPQPDAWARSCVHVG